MWKLPTFILGSAAVIAMIIRFFGVSTETLPEQFQDHVATETTWHIEDKISDSIGASHIQHIESRLETIDEAFFME